MEVGAGAVAWRRRALVEKRYGVTKKTHYSSALVLEQLG
jgi:hypothetical protein